MASCNRRPDVEGHAQRKSGIVLFAFVCFFIIFF